MVSENYLLEIDEESGKHFSLAAILQRSRNPGYKRAVCRSAAS